MQPNQDLKFQTLFEISPNFYNDQRLHDFVSVYLFQLVKYQSLSLLQAFIISVPPVKKKNKQTNKLTRTISYSNKALKSFHHNPPNNHALAITLLEFLVHALSIPTSQQIVNQQNMHVKTILYLQKILSIFWLSNTWFGY